MCVCIYMYELMRVYVTLWVSNARTIVYTYSNVYIHVSVFICAWLWACLNGYVHSNCMCANVPTHAKRKALYNAHQYTKHGTLYGVFSIRSVLPASLFSPCAWDCIATIFVLGISTNINTTFDILIYTGNLDPVCVFCRTFGVHGREITSNKRFVFHEPRNSDSLGVWWLLHASRVSYVMKRPFAGVWGLCPSVRQEPNLWVHPCKWHNDILFVRQVYACMDLLQLWVCTSACALANRLGKPETLSDRQVGGDHEDLGPLLW